MNYKFIMTFPAFQVSLPSVTDRFSAKSVFIPSRQVVSGEE
jgi:hypothetical protein